MRTFVQNLVAATTSKQHCRRAEFARETGGAARRKSETDLEVVEAYLMSQQGGAYSKQDAYRKARSPAMSAHVRTYSRPVEEMVSEIETTMAFHESEDQKTRKGGGLPLLLPDRPPRKKGPQGARQAANNLIACLRKGCGTDPLPMEDM